MGFNFNQPYGYLRILHAIPQVDSYDCYLNDKLYAKDLLFEDFTPYKPISAGEHQIALCKHKSTESLLTHSLWISPGKIYTLLLTYQPAKESIEYYLLNDPPRKMLEDHLLLRVAPFCQIDSPFEIHLADTKPIFKKLKLCQPSPYLAFTASTYTLELFDINTQKVLLNRENCLLKTYRYYTLYLLGGTKAFPLRFVLTIDGNSFLSFPDITY